jgi:hypothetical protein
MCNQQHGRNSQFATFLISEQGRSYRQDQQGEANRAGRITTTTAVIQ